MQVVHRVIARFALISIIVQIFNPYIFQISNTHAMWSISSDLNLWLKADEGTNTIVDGEGVTSWEDQSWSWHDAAWAWDTTYVSSLFNFNPSLNFTDDDRPLTGSMDRPNGLEASIFVVGRIPVVDDRALIEFSQGSSRRGFFFDDRYAGNISYDFQVNTPSVWWVGDPWGTTPSSIYENASNIDTASKSFTTNWTTWGAYHIWDDSTWGNRLTWEISEILYYDTNLSLADRSKVDSYLALKYGITLSWTWYIDSSWQSVYDSSLWYDQDVVGIARDDGSSLDQRVSHSANTGAILTIATDDDFVSTNGWSRTQLSDGQYLVIWSNWGITTDQLTELDTTTFDSRIIREWKVENTGAVWSIHLNFDGFDDAYSLLVDADGDFSSWSINQWKLSASGSMSITLSDGQYFTLAQGSRINSPLDVAWSVFWLDASDTSTLYTDNACTLGQDIATLWSADGTAVQCWADKSGSGAHVSSLSTERSPSYVANGWTEHNNLSTVDFVKANADTLRRDIANWSGENTFFIVFEQRSNGNTFDSFFSNGFSSGPNHFQVAIRANNTFAWTADTNLDFEPEAQNQLKLYATRWSTNLTELFVDGDNVASDPTTGGRVYSGYKINQNRNNNSYNDSRISEVIIYDRALDNCEVEQVNNYLWDKFWKDFSWFADSYSLWAPFDNGVNAIGRTSSECWGETIINTMQSSELTVDNPSSNDTVDEFLSFASNSSPVTAFATDVPVWVTKRQEKTWRVDEDGDLWTVDAEFDLVEIGLTGTGIDTYALLIDTDGDFSDAIIYPGSNLSWTGYIYADNKVKFTNLDFNSGDFFALAILDTTVPSVTINQSASTSDPITSTWALPILFDVVFSEPVDTTTFTCPDVTLSWSATTTCSTVTEISPNDKTTFQVSVSGSTLGTVIASIGSWQITDILWNQNIASTSSDNIVTISDIFNQAPTDISLSWDTVDENVAW